MTSAPVSKPPPRRTFTAFGELRRMPSEYEIVTEGQNWTLRGNRPSTFEQNPSSLANMWFLTHRDRSPLTAPDWNAFRDPSHLTYRAYVGMQSDAETKMRGVLAAHAASGADFALEPRAVALLGQLFTPSRYLCHGLQQAEAYIGLMAPSPYITSAAAYATADWLRRVTTIAYRTRELQTAFPGSGIGDRERAQWEHDDAWQPTRKAIEYALATYDWGEAFTAINLVLAPTFDDVLLTQLGQAAGTLHDTLTWLLTTFLAEDSERRDAWSRTVVDVAVAQRPANRAVLDRWIPKWSELADDAAGGLASILVGADESLGAAGVVEHASRAREDMLAGLLDPIGDHRSVPLG